MLEKFIGLLTLEFELHTSITKLAELLYISIEAGPVIAIANEFQFFVLTEIASKNMIMIILENIYIEITSKWYIDSTIKMKKTFGVHRPSAICRNVFCSSKVTRKSQTNILVQCVEINNCSCVKRKEKKDSSLYEGCKLFLSEDWFEFID